MNLNELNERQKNAVLTTDGPLMILAGAGSGKTRTLVAKICYLLEEKQVSPYKILAVTFSNKAAKEMRDRVSVLSSIDAGALQISTFHAFCASILRSEASYLGLGRSFTIYDDSESKAIAKSILAKRGISTKEISPFEVLSYISDIKNNGYYHNRVDPEGFEIDKDDPFYAYYLEYESELHKSNAIDFGGLIVAVIELFEKYPKVLEHYQNRYKYLLVDEYQDTNRAQFELVRLLAENTKNICVVGDEDQSIYSWRGADIRNILDFEKVFQDSQTIKLEQNYRSSQKIIEAATCVISKNEFRKGKNMWTDNDEGEKVHIVECLNDKKEAEFVVKKIKELKKAGESYQDMAVFYRNNAQSRIIEDQLRANKIAYRVIGGVKFYDRKEIKDILGYIRLVVNEKDSLALTRVVNTPARGIGATTLRKFEQKAIAKGLSLWEAFCDYLKSPEDYSDIRISKKAKSALYEFVNLIQEIKVLNENKELPSTIFDKVLHESGYFAFIKGNKDYETIARLENLEELRNAIGQFEMTNKVATLSGFLETITLDANRDEEGDIGDVSLMTVHGSKGLEFPYVFVVAAEENLFPSYRSIDDGEMAIEEERRLFYVAMTRAMKGLYISFARARLLFGDLKYNGHSRFLDEIPEGLFEWSNFGKAKDDYTSDDFEFDEFSQVAGSEEEAVYEVGISPRNIKFPIGTFVVHNLYGEGQIIESEGEGKDEKVVIRFKDGAHKRFMVEFAPIMELT